MRELIGSTSITKKYDFCGKKGSVEIKKLSGAQVKAFQKTVESFKNLPVEEQGTKVQNQIIRIGVIGADDMTDDELDEFPLDEVSKLALEVLSFSGINLDKDKEMGNA